MKKALIIVDYQYDFVAEDGKLSAGEAARNIEHHLVKLIEDFNSDGNYSGVIFTYDSHNIKDFTESSHPEGKVFPPHCIYGEKGYGYYGKLKNYEEKPDSNILLLSKRGYSLNSDIISQLVDKYNDFTFAGVVTDICVFQNVIAFYNCACNKDKPIKITVDTKGCASFNPEREQECLKYMKEVLGVEIL